MTTLYEIIKSLQTTQGTKAKQAILDANRDNELLKAYLKAVYDPAISYYQTKIPKMVGHGLNDLDDLMLRKLGFLSNRTLTGTRAKDWLATMGSHLTPESQELLGYIIKRSIDAKGVGETMILNTFPGLFFVPPYNRCKGMDDKAEADTYGRVIDQLEAARSVEI